MTHSKIQVTLYDGDSVLKNWEESYETDLSEVIDTVRHVKESINDYLTQLVNQGKCDKVSDQVEDSSADEVEDESAIDVDSDIISGFIKNMGIDGGNSKRSLKQKDSLSKHAKKLRK